MGNSTEKNNVFDAALQRIVYLKPKCYAAVWFVLTFVLAIDTYAIGINNFNRYITKVEESWGKLIISCTLYLIMFYISYIKLKPLRCLKSKECKKNERR